MPAGTLQVEPVIGFHGLTSLSHSALVLVSASPSLAPPKDADPKSLFAFTVVADPPGFNFAANSQHDVGRLVFASNISSTEISVGGVVVKKAVLARTPRDCTNLSEPEDLWLLTGDELVLPAGSRIRCYTVPRNRLDNAVSWPNFSRRPETPPSSALR